MRLTLFIINLPDMELKADSNFQEINKRLFGFMRKGLPFAIILMGISAGFCNAQLQSTWIKSLFYDGGGYSSYRNDGISVGPSAIVFGPAGKYFVLNKDYEDGSQTIYMMDSLGTIINSNLVAGQTSTTQNTAFSLRSTPDSGCTILMHHENFSFLVFEYSLLKIDKNGVLSTIHTWNYPDTVTDAFQLPNGEFVCILNHQIQNLNTGIVYPGTSFGIKIFSNGDQLYTTPSSITRQNIDGTIIWSTPITPLNSTISNENIIYVKSSTIYKVDAVSGNILWNRPIPASGTLYLTEKNEGFALISNNLLTVCDSSANLITQNTFNDNPRFYYSSAVGNTIYKFLKDGSLVVGGYFPSFTSYSNAFKRSSMLIKLDETGKGTLDSTSFYFSGDCDLDSAMQFYDDAAYIAAALGDSSGNQDMNFWQFDTKYVFSADWPVSFKSGLNYKSLDANFNGIIDPGDYTFGYNNYSGYWPHHQDSSGVEIYSIARNAYLSQGDSVIVDIILGSISNPIDSMYALSFEYRVACGPSQSDSLVMDFKPYFMGDSIINLYTGSNFGPNTNYHTARAAISRRDHQNVMVAGDTIVTIRGAISQFYYPGTWDQCLWMHIISEGGYTIPVRIISNQINISPLNKNAEILPEKNVKIFPVPASNFLNIVSDDAKIQHITLKNIAGQIIFSQSIDENRFLIDTRNISSGIYFAECVISGKLFRSKVIISRQ